jgi:hypothetical protein
MHRFAPLSGKQGTQPWERWAARIGTGKQPTRWPPGSPIEPQQFQQFGRQQSLSILPSFTAPNPQHVASAVGNFPVQRMGIEESECAYGLDVSGLRHSSLFDLQQLIAANMLGIELIGRLEKYRANSATTCR